jgi:hypothetical protein
MFFPPAKMIGRVRARCALPHWGRRIPSRARARCAKGSGRDHFDGQRPRVDGVIVCGADGNYLAAPAPAV